MTGNYLANPIIFIIDTLFSLYLSVIALRLIMQWAQWEYHNPLVQFIIKLTQPPVKILRRFIPAVGRWDTATIFFLIGMVIVKILLIGLISGALPQGLFWLNLILAELFKLFIGIFTISIIVEAILSWVAPATYNPVIPLLRSMNAPLLTPVRKIIPLIGGMDLSPLFVLLGLQVLSMLVLPILIGHY